MKQFKQFIIHKYKVPADYRTGSTRNVNAHNAQVWTDHETAATAAKTFGGDYGVGFVFTPADPFWFIDIDKCLVNGAWSSTAQELCAIFAGCYIEISQSGSGLHIIGTGFVPAHGCRNKDLGLEFYTEGRYMALGHSGVGDPMHDATTLMPMIVERFFPPADETAGAGWREGHELGWELPGDDELISRALAMRGGAAAAFGGKLTFADLWKADPAALGRAYPDANGRPYDASAADMALASKLAWLTGNDCPRIERLMQRSGLVREKWEKHKAYLGGFTIPRALVRDAVFYDPKYRERRDAQRAENKRIGDDSAGGSPLADVLSIDQMIERYANVIEGKRVVDIENPRRIFALDEWKSAHKSSTTMVEVPGEFKLDGSAKIKSFDTAAVWEKSPVRKQFDTVTFRPGYGLETEDPEGKHAVNTWRPLVRAESVASPALFVNHIEYLFGQDAGRFLDWLAHIEQKPGILPHTGWVHISPMQGTGRNWLSCVLVKLWRGYVAASFDLGGTLKNGYNGALSQKLLAVVDEINEGGSGAKWENAEVLKSIVTPAYRHVNPKYGYQRLEYNACRWLIFSNHTSALPLTEGDRRFNIVQNDNPPMPEQYYRELYGSLDTPGFIEAVAWMLTQRDVSGFNPGAHALLNEAKRDLVASSRTEVDDAIRDLIENNPSDVIINSKLAMMLNAGSTQFGAKMALTPHHRHAMQRYGIIPYGKPIRLEHGLVKVSILRNHKKWKNAEYFDIKEELIRI